MNIDITIDLPEGCLETSACFDVQTETYSAEPYSWGQSRGTEIEVSATFQHCKIGGTVFDRLGMTKLVGEEFVSNLEDMAAEGYNL